jgi:hypothetical protein
MPACSQGGGRGPREERNGKTFPQVSLGIKFAIDLLAKANQMTRLRVYTEGH